MSSNVNLLITYDKYHSNGKFMMANLCDEILAMDARGEKESIIRLLGNHALLLSAPRCVLPVHGMHGSPSRLEKDRSRKDGYVWWVRE